MTMTAICIQNVSKKYLIRHQGRERYTALRDVLANNIRRVSSHFGYGNQPAANGDGYSETFWALKDIDLQIKAGDRLGIIGRNGAGKSTLLKLISRITEPTTGRIVINGRMASLLEVGTGFHPELTGRENIFLNGAILGMSKREIKDKFDAITDFADVEKFLDTPVKRYSSGMYVRLAFSVAAHLDPDILVVDEVLAVGDASFQKKCLGKMEEVSSQGRTLLFVSHNMATITSLCRTAILLEEGKIKKIGPTSDVVMSYYTNGAASPASVDYSQNGKFVGDRYARLLGATVKNDKNEATLEITITEGVAIEMRFEILEDSDLNFEPNFHFFSADGVCAFASQNTDKRKWKKGVYVTECLIPGNLLNEGSYFVGLALSSFDHGVAIHFYERSAISFNVYDPIEGVPTRSEWSGPIQGVVRPLLAWTTRELR